MDQQQLNGCARGENSSSYLCCCCQIAENSAIFANKGDEVSLANFHKSSGKYFFEFCR